jgi:hypothetical protein
MSLISTRLQKTKESLDMDDEKNLLVIGPPRSGTTLLAAILSCHSEICILMEEFRGSSRLILSKKIKGVKLCIPALSR